MKKSVYIFILAGLSTSFLFVAVYAHSATTISTNISTGGTLTVTGVSTLADNLDVSGTTYLRNHVAIQDATVDSVHVFDLEENTVITSSGLVGIRSLLTANPSGTTNATYTGVNGAIVTTPGNDNDYTNAYLWGGYFSAAHSGDGDLSYLYGSYSEAVSYSAGTIALARGLRGRVLHLDTGTITDGRALEAFVGLTSTGTIIDSYSVYVSNPANTGGGTITNNYGIYIEDQTTGDTDYSIYSVGGNNYFGGDVGIGTTTPATKLEVYGGSMRAFNTASSTCDATTRGAIFYNEDNDIFWGCRVSGWANLNN